MMDEFAALGHLKIIETTWALARGYGIQMMPVLQDLNQLKSLYKERWETFLGNAGAIASFAPNDQTTAEWLSKRLGDTTRIARSESRRDDRSASDNNANYSPVKVPFMTPHELYGLEPGHMVLLMAGLSNATRIYVPPYFRVDERDRRARVNPYFHPVPRRRNLPPPANNSGGTWATSGVTTVDIFRQAFGSVGQKQTRK